MSKNSPGADWQPSCSWDALRGRARMLADIRDFFSQRGVLEVETPLLCRHIGTDPHLDFFALDGSSGATRYLQTSPEFAMKRLLAAGGGSIYQICKAFRGDECGRMHNPEFTILEWYRVGFSLSQLMDEVELLLRQVAPDLGGVRFRRASYRQVFQEQAGVDVARADAELLAECAARHGICDAEAICGSDVSAWLDLLFSLLVQPRLGWEMPCFIFDYPSCQAALARRKPGDPRWVERVELFWRGVELANGFHELADAQEQAQRFDGDRAARRERGLPVPEVDRCLLAALEHGLPDCSGIAMGLDRLLMLVLGLEHIDQVLAFPYARA